MDKSSKRFQVHLGTLINSGKIKKIDLHRKSKIPRASIDGYLDRGSVPDLNALDKIAEALEIDPVELIKPIDKKPISLPHTLDDCLEVVAKAAKGNISVVSSKKSEEQLIPDHLLRKIRALSDSDKEIFFLQLESSLKALGADESDEQSNIG